MGVHLVPAPLTDGVEGWFTGRALDEPDPPVGRAGNLAHRRPHRPGDLARARQDVGRRTGTDPATWHLMRQVHGDRVAVVHADTPAGEHRDVDGLVTTAVGRPLVVQTADCVPILLVGPHVVGVAHAGRRGVVAGIVDAVVGAARRLDEGPLRAVLGPAIGGCCYELPREICREIGAHAPDAVTETTWGTPSVDMRTAVAEQLRAVEVRDVDRVGGCTRCDPDGLWFSHRADPSTGRQIGLLVRRDRAGSEGAA